MHTQDAIRTSSPTQNSWSEPRITLGLKIMQRQAGHSWASTTAGYTTVGADHSNRMLRAAVDRAFIAVPQGNSR
jgi:hypothetical protein